jgi:sialate O-acetylesterase
MNKILKCDLTTLSAALCPDSGFTRKSKILKYFIMKRFLFKMVITMLIFPITSSIAEIKLASIFTDNMVLQQQSEVAIWGWAASGASINIKPSWDGKSYTTKSENEGKWKLKIATPKAGGPYEIVISDGKPFKLVNVLIGEVWLCSGQSNMEMPMKGFKGQPIKGSNDAILHSKNKNIRLITVPRSSKTEPQDSFKGQWQEASPATVADFSATGYYFGRLVNEIIDVPVGLINVSYSGSCIEAWMSKKTAQPFEKTGIPQKGDSIKALSRTPTVLFNGMLNPVIGFGIKGCIWYQGESNYKYPQKYIQLFSTMINEWRSLWGIGEFPYYYAQIAPYNYGLLDPKDTVKYNSALLRDAQRKAQDSIKNCAMTTLMEIGEENSIHPMDKKTGGERLAYLALGKTYGITGFGYECPTLDSISVKDTAIVISFRNIPNGMTSYGKELTTFEIAGSDKVFYPAKAKLGRKTVTVYAKDVKKPIAVRYAFKDFVVGELFSNEGLPVSSFRTDNW